MYIRKGSLAINVSDIGKDRVLDALEFFSRVLENIEGFSVIFNFINNLNNGYGFVVASEKGQYCIHFDDIEGATTKYGADKYGFLYLDDISDVFDLCAELCNNDDFKSIAGLFEGEPF